MTEKIIVTQFGSLVGWVEERNPTKNGSREIVGFRKLNPTYKADDYRPSTND
ncbi:MAG: hypothetical protein ABII25_06210 [bacterium]